MTEQAIKDRQAVAKGLECIPGGVVIFRGNEQGELLYANPYVIDFYDCANEAEFKAFTGNTIYTMVRPEEQENLRQCLREERTGPAAYYRMRYTACTKKGRLRHLDVIDRVVQTAAGELLHYSVTLPVWDNEVGQDAMTGTTRFLTYASQFLAFYRHGTAMPPMSLIFFNIERFKLYNIKYGIDAGSQLLARCAAVLQETFANDFVFCISDDRFAILTEAGQVRERVTAARNVLRQDFADRVVAFHFGCYRITDPAENLHQALDMARLACESIRGSVETYFCEGTKDLAAGLDLRAYVVGHIDEAVEKDWIRPYYQPVVALSGLRHVGFEALARWIDPVHGLIMPKHFISALEDSQQIDKLDRHMIRAVCREYRQRVDAGETVLPVSVNLSRLDFLLCNAYEVLEENVRAYGVPRQMLRVELTESLLLDEGERIKEEIAHLRQAGYELWIDDFGSGYSSLNTLKNYDFDVVKLDRMFLEPFTGKAKKILGAVLSMNQALGIRSLGEGLETTDELRFFCQPRCELAQGYLLGRPLPYEESLAECAEKRQCIRQNRNCLPG